MEIVWLAVTMFALAALLAAILRPRGRHLCHRCQHETDSMYRYVTEKKELRKTPYVRHVSDRLKEICSQCGTPYLRFKG